MRNQLPITEQFAIEETGELILLECLPMLIEAGFQNAGFGGDGVGRFLFFTNRN